MPLREGETMSKRCDNCRWWDNEPWRDMRVQPQQEPGLYGECVAPIPISLSESKYAMVAEAPIEGDTNAEQCQLYAARELIACRRWRWTA